MLDDDERAELERLREEIRALREPPSRRGWRPAAAAVSVVLGCLLAPVALTAVWLHNQVADTDRFTDTVRPLVHDPSVRAALTDRVTATVFTYVDVRGAADQAVDALGLPPRITERLHDLTGPLALGVRNFVHTRLDALFASDEFAAAFDRTVRVAHEQANAVLSGTTSAVAIQGDRVTLDLAPFIDTAKHQLVEAGFTAAGRVPEVHPTIAIADAAVLVRARTVYTAVDRLAMWLPWMTIVLLALGVLLADDHRRTILAAGLGVAGSMLALAIALVITRGVLVGTVPSSATAATAATYDIVVRFLRTGLRTVFVLGLVVALGAFLAGPSATAVRIRQTAVEMLSWLRLRVGLQGGTWVYTHRAALRAATTAVAVLSFVFLDRPTPAAVIVIATLLVVALAVLQFLARPPTPPTTGEAQPAGPPAR